MEHLDIVLLPDAHVVELGLHAGCKLGIDNLGEMLLQQAGHCLAQLGGDQLLLVALHIAAPQNGGDDRRVRTRAADAVLLHRLDEGSLRIARGRLGEVLVARELLLRTVSPSLSAGSWVSFSSERSS